MCVRSTSLTGQAGRVVLGEETKDKGEEKKEVSTPCRAKWGSIGVWCTCNWPFLCRHKAELGQPFRVPSATPFGACGPLLKL